MAIEEEAPGRQTITTFWKDTEHAVDIIGGEMKIQKDGLKRMLLIQKVVLTCIGPINNEFCTPLVGHCDAPIPADTKKQILKHFDTF